MTTLATCVGEETDQTTYLGSANFGTSQPVPAKPAARVEPQLAEIQCLCPFCGEFNIGIGKPCLHCEMEDTVTSRMDATHHTGQWHVLRTDLAISLESETSGMAFDDLRSLIRQHIVTPRSIVRGPATGQLFRLAATVRGLGREFGQCYSCGGEIETTTNVCPHCDRIQTVQEWVESKASAPIIEDRVTQTPVSEVTPRAGSNTDEAASSKYENRGHHKEPLIPETSATVRQALLGQPTIRVHSLSHPDEIGDHAEVEFNVRPVIAERTERHVPKDDLLTPGELAKAFQKEFGMDDNTDRPYRVPGLIERQIKVVLAGSSAMAIAFLAGMQVIRMINGPTPPAHPRLAAVTTPTTPIAIKPVISVKPVAPVVAEARLASDAVFARHLPVEKPSEPYELADPCADTTPAKPVATPAPTLAATPPVKAAPAEVTPVAPVAKVIAVAPVAPAASPVATQAPAPKSVARTNMTQVSQVMLVGDDDPATLLKTGLAAEASGNYAAAVTAYERIQSLPGSMWPPQLATRLQLARKELKGEVH